MTSQTPATRALLFMRQCRSRHNLILTKTTNRSVSSSHLAPSNFSKPLRARPDTLPANPDRRLPGQSYNSPSYSHPTALPPPITQLNYRVPGGFLSFLKYQVLKLPLPPPPTKPPPFNVLNNPYRARKSWPPDFRLMHPKQQFYFEKTFRRRMIIKTNSLRYNWNRYTKLLQHSLIILTLLYFLFIADPWQKEGLGTPVDGFRAWFFGRISQSEHLPEGLVEQAKDLESYYKKPERSPWHLPANWKLSDSTGNEEVEGKGRGTAEGS